MPDPEEPLWDYSFAPPADFVWRDELVPIDSRGKVWRGTGIPEFSVSVDSYAGQPAACNSGPPCRQWRERLNGRLATVSRDAWLNEGEGIRSTVRLYLPLIQRRDRVTLALTVSANCTTRAACDRALEIARTIKVVRRPQAISS